MASILVFFCLPSNYPLLPSKQYFPLNEATTANLQANKRTIKWQPFWNKVYNERSTPVYSNNNNNQASKRREGGVTI